MHQFLLHPVFVFLAWLIIYRRLPRLYELMAIITHDLGYWGKRDMDGAEGESHPEATARIWQRHFGKFGERVADEILGHSGYYVRYNGAVLSKLYRADKLAGALYPMWLYLLLGNLSGEIREYMSCPKYDNSGVRGQIQWLISTQAYMARVGLYGEGA